jgi:Flp pilus assembly protein TadD
METLEPPDIFHLSAATGWIELGNPGEAKAELGKVAAHLGCHPDVLEVRWSLLAAEKQWQEAVQVAEQILQVSPDRWSGWLHRAYALRRAPGGGLQAAWNALLPAVDQFPHQPTIPYNLACYACQMGQTDEGRRWLKRALAVGKKAPIKSMALADPDLQPLWSEIRDL